MITMQTICGKKRLSEVLILHFLVAILCIGFGELSFAQATSNPVQDPAPVTQNSSMNYFKIEVGMHILDCPVLPPQLKSKLMTLQGIKDYTVNMKNETILFTLPEGVATKEQIVKIALNSGFPASAVNVIVDTKPFVN